MFVVVLGVAVHHRVPGGDDPRQDVVQPVGGAQREPLRLTVGYPEQVDAREAVGLLLAHDRGVSFGHQIRHVLQGVAEFVGQHTVDGHVAEIPLRDGHEHPAVPGDQVAT